jgi:hypothetical protein
MHNLHHFFVVVSPQLFLHLHTDTVSFACTGLRPDSRLLPSIVVIPEDQCRIKREAKQKMRNLATTGSASSTVGADRKSSSSPQQVTSTDSTSSSTGDSTQQHSASSSVRGLTLEQQELVNRLMQSQQQFDYPSDAALSKLSVRMCQRVHGRKYILPD